MLKAMLTVVAVALAGGTLVAPGSVHAENLLVQRLQTEQTMQLPARGMTMAQVERKYGKPVRKLQPRGGDTALHPVIRRWEYGKYIVYFEHDHVIHSVLNTPAGNNLDPKQVH